MDQTQLIDLKQNLRKLIAAGDLYQDVECIDFIGVTQSHLLWKQIKDLFEWENKTVIDLGCNCGYFSFKVCNSGGVVIGLDRDPDKIEIIQLINTLTKNKVKFKVWESKEPIPEANITLCLNFLHHCPDIEFTLNNINSKYVLFRVNPDEVFHIQRYFKIKQMIPEKPKYLPGAIGFNDRITVIGQKLQLVGQGILRNVFLLDNNTIIKTPRYNPKETVDCEDGKQANIDEYNNWLKVKDTQHEKWFAPCIKLLEDGSLIMKRVQSIDTENLPSKFRIPGFLRDYMTMTGGGCLENWGMLDGRWVICDYHRMAEVTDDQAVFDPAGRPFLLEWEAYKSNKGLKE